MNIDKLELQDKKDGINRVNEIMKMQTDNNLYPKTISYKDIDTEMTSFVSKQLNLIFSGKEIPTFFFTQQRMSEFTKTWEVVDDNHNVLPNFKTLTRENNPKPGTLMGEMSNIPGEPLFEIGTFEKWDGNKNITVTCKMKQPYCVDIIYNVKFITNRLNLLNELNNIVIDKFKSKQSYIVVNGHYMPVILEDIGDESDYELDQRKIFIQNFQLKVSGYIINESDIIFEENIVRTMVSIETDYRKPKVISPMTDKNIIIEFPVKGKKIISFKADRNFNISSINTTNVLSYDLYLNNIIVNDIINILTIKKYDKILVKISKISRNQLSTITLA